MDASAYSLNAPAIAGPDETAAGPRRVGKLHMRRLISHDDYAKAVELQRTTWGPSFTDIVPSAILKVTQRVGGVSAGAFSDTGELYGFVYGLTGFYEGRCAHWSHMLAVKPTLRDHGIGRGLKEFQRQLLIEAGVDWMYWTFDPLVARNAHLNLNRLKVEVREYVQDMYGNTGSDLHAFGTDRFVVAWSVKAPQAHRDIESNPALRTVWLEDSPVLNHLSTEELARVVANRPQTVLVEVPQDIEALSVTEARAWREATRHCFLAALSQGYEVTSFHRGEDRECYVLTHPNA